MKILTSLLSILLFSICFVNGSDEGFATLPHPKICHYPMSDSSRPAEKPVIPGDFADPSVIRVGNIYYATGTSSEWAPHFPLYTSSDLISWKQLGYALNETPAWSAASFWAPELFYRNGTYYLYYSARKKSDGTSCIALAVSKDPAKGFTDRGIVLEFGKEAIDAFVLEDNGNLFISWKAYGLDSRPIELLCSRLSDDGMKLIGEPFMLLRDDGKTGIEGQCIVKRNDYFYLFYSPGACCGRKCSYSVEVARSANLRGPYTKYESNPILSETKEWKCSGHGTLVSTANGEDFYMYHAYNKAHDVYTGRQAMLAKVTWNNQTGWPSLHPQGDKAGAIQNFRDEFVNANLSMSWQWDFRNTEPELKLTNGRLSLSGNIKEGNLSGTALTIRPALGSYEFTTQVLNSNGSMKGLVLYGDAGQAVGIGAINDSVAVWEVRNNKRTVLTNTPLNRDNEIHLRMSVRNGYQCFFYWSNDGKQWNELNAGRPYYNGDFLPPWDRSPRPGLIHFGSPSQPAEFGFFEIVYQ